MPIIEHLDVLGENDPLIRAMMGAAGTGGLRDVAQKIEELDAQADEASFLDAPTILNDQRRTPTELESIPAGESISSIGPYQLIRQIGRGGFGRVYEGYRQDSPGQKLAVKVFENRWLDDIERLEIEKLVLQKLNHPSLVTAIESGAADDGTAYLVMNLIDGIRIDQFVRRQGLEFIQIAKLFRQIAEAMAYAHGQDVVHRDLKPGNILITKDGTPVVTDFGLAKRLNLEGGRSLTATGTLMGTLGYLAPEQADPKRREVTRSVDVYGLGATLYHVLTGHAPFERENLLKALDDLRTQSPKLPTSYNPDIPPDLERICLKCLAKSPQDRYESMQALATDLQRFVDGRRVAARPLGWNRRFWRCCNANPVIAGLSVGLGVAVFAGLVASTILWQQAVGQQEITAELLAKAIVLSQSDDKLAETMLVQSPDTLEYRYQRLLNSVEFLDGAIKTFPEDDVLYRESATSHFLLGKVCCLQAKFTDASVTYQTALSRFRELAAAHPEDHTLQFDVFHSLLGLDQVDRELLGLPDQEEGKMADAFEIIQQLTTAHPENTDYCDALICMQNLIYGRRFRGDLPKLLELYQSTYNNAVKLKAQFPEPCLQWRHVSGSAHRLAALYLELGDLEQAETWLQIAIREISEFLTRPDLDPGEWMDLAQCLALAHKLETRKGDHPKAADYAQQWHELIQDCIRKYPDYHVFREALERADVHLGEEN